MKVADMHCDTISELLEKKRKGSAEDLNKNQGHIDLCKLEKGDAILQNFALFVNMERVDNPLEEVLQMVDLYYGELKKNGDRIAPAFGWRDIENNMKQGKISALLTVEEGGVCKGNTAYLRTLYRLGVRMMTLTWNYPNEIGYPNINASYSGSLLDNGTKKGHIPFYKIPDTKHGLTEKGREIVEQMEAIGMIVDVSHLSDAGFYDVLEITKKPFAASHSNARGLCPWVRNMTDDMIRKLAERGGVIGLNYCPDFLTEVAAGEKNPGTIAAIVEHAKYIMNVGGIDCLGLGSDFDGINIHRELPDYSFMQRLADAFLKEGFSENSVAKIFHKNVLRLYKELL